MGGSLEFRGVRRLTSRVAKSIMKSHHVRIPKYEMPIRLRPVITTIPLLHSFVQEPSLQWFLVFTCFIMLVLAFLGFTNFSRSLPLNDKLLHFLCFCIATAVFYFIIDVEECVVYCYGIKISTQFYYNDRSSRRIWFWRHSALIFTGFTCFFCGGILSEFVQAALPVQFFFLLHVFYILK